MSAPAEIPRVRRRPLPFGRLLLALWGAGALSLSAYLLGSHLLALPAPAAADPRLVQSLATLSPHDGRLTLVHALYESCRCSQNVLAHLVARGPRADARELVLVVDGEDTTLGRVREAGFEARRITPADLHDRYGIEGAPLLAIADATGGVRYVGGYGDRKQSPVVRDGELADRVAHGEPVDSLPLFGCPTSEALRSSLDPVGVAR